MRNKTVLIQALIGALLLLSISSENASGVNFTLVVVTPSHSDGTQYGSSGGDGSGGSGVVTSEPSNNIEKTESLDRDLIADIPVIYTYKMPELGIYEIVLTGKEDENDIAVRVEALKGTSKLVTKLAPGIVYKNVNIWAGTKQIKEVLIRFRVENSWIIANNLAGSDVRMVKWDGGKWIMMETSEKSKDNTYTFYEAKTDASSIFAITGVKIEAAPIATQAIEITETPSRPIVTSKSIEPKGTPGFEVLMAMALLSVVHIFRRRRL